MTLRLGLALSVPYWRALGLILLPFTTGLTLAVVYGQFHYAADALAGLILAAVMLGVMQTAEATEPRPVTQPPPPQPLVSDV